MFVVPFFREKIDCDFLKIKNECFEEKNKGKGKIASNVGGWQSNSNPLDFIKNNSNLFINVGGKVNNFSSLHGMNDNLRMNNCWININDYKSYNMRHIHPGCMWSAILYIQTPENCGDIIFYNPAFNLMSYDWREVKYYNHFNSPLWKINAESGDLLIFPSWIEHEVNPNLNENEDRISIAMNFG